MVRGSATSVEGKPIASPLPKLHELQLTGMARAHAGDFPAALAALREAAAIEGKTSRPPGPPVEKPAHELLGEVLLRAGESKGAIAQFKVALDRHPNRALSLLGLARAEAAAGEKTAARLTYAKLMDIWQQADADLPELREAREYIASGQALASRG
jgi:tetratricopeptide (TPR) repeat protein